MSILHGFERISEKDIPELRTTAELFRHQKTGAELLSLVRYDENKVFGITFRTPPTDSTGVAHILEHSVLCGSRKYPIKEDIPVMLIDEGDKWINTAVEALPEPGKLVE